MTSTKYLLFHIHPPSQPLPHNHCLAFARFSTKPHHHQNNLVSTITTNKLSANFTADEISSCMIQNGCLKCCFFNSLGKNFVSIRRTFNAKNDILLYLIRKLISFPQRRIVVTLLETRCNFTRALPLYTERNELWTKIPLLWFFDSSLQSAN